jgi:hypothetical protein
MYSLIPNNLSLRRQKKYKKKVRCEPVSSNTPSFDLNSGLYQNAGDAWPDAAHNLVIDGLPGFGDVFGADAGIPLLA